jgi:hypothetical protein
MGILADGPNVFKKNLPEFDEIARRIVFGRYFSKVVCNCP